jgi:hypothetical protein
MFVRDRIVQNLTRVRKDWECETGMTVEADFLLYDICQAIGLDDAETQRIIGAVPLAVIEAAITDLGEAQNGF